METEANPAPAVSTETGNPPQTPPAAPPPPPPPPAPSSEAAELPHTAAVVLNGERSEREVQLQAEIDALKSKIGGTEQTVKAREMRINELEDENRQLKLARESEPKAKKKVVGCGWFETEEED